MPPYITPKTYALHRIPNSFVDLQKLLNQRLTGPMLPDSFAGHQTTYGSLCFCRVRQKKCNDLLYGCMDASGWGTLFSIQGFIVH